MRITRFHHFTIASLFTVLATLGPDALGQLPNVTDGVVFDVLSLIEEQESLSLSVGGQQSNNCVSPVVGLDDRPTQVLSPVRILPGINSLEQIKAPPECVLTVCYTGKQKRRWNKCRQDLPCDSYHMCSNERGDKFASCKKKYCAQSGTVISKQPTGGT